MSHPFDPRILAFFANLPQQGPGTDQDTLAALELIAASLPPAPRVADLGCGTGRTTLALARALEKATVVACDLSETFLHRLDEMSLLHGLSARVRTQVADIGSPPFAEASFDLIWSEGAAYNIGFAKALETWRRLLEPAGFCVVSECEWLTSARPIEAVSFWQSVYPDMATREENLASAKAAGYDVLATRVLPREGWAAYYEPIARALADGRAAGLGDAFVSSQQEELAIYQASEHSYGYVFYVLRREESAFQEQADSAA